MLNLRANKFGNSVGSMTNKIWTTFCTLVLLLQLSTPQPRPQQQRYFVQPFSANGGPSNTPSELFRPIAAPIEQPQSSSAVKVPTFIENRIQAPTIFQRNIEVPIKSNRVVDPGANIKFVPSSTNPFLNGRGSPIQTNRIQGPQLEPRFGGPEFFTDVPNGYYRFVAHTYTFDSDKDKPEEYHYVYDSRNKAPQQIFY